MSIFTDHPSIVVLNGIIEKDGKFLFVKEASGPDVGKWNLPAGMWGLNEGLIEGAAREVKEETGFDFVPEKVVGINTFVKTIQGVTTNVLKVFVAGKIEGEQAEVFDDVAEVGWFTFSEILAMESDQLRDLDIKLVLKDYSEDKGFELELLKNTGKH